jgi:hypothetical protein
VVRVPDDGGPLYLSINDEPAGMDNNAQAITVSVSIAAVAKPTPAQPGAGTKPAVQPSQHTR